MRALLAASMMAASLARTSAAVVEAGTLTTLTVTAPKYDTTISSADGGCSPEGCVGGNTRDGDTTTVDSRWSCKPDLGPAGSTCSITYTFTEPLDVVGLNVAMYKGDSRTRSMDIYVVDGDRNRLLQTSWTSSGTTAAFESLKLEAQAQAIELQGVLDDDSEWLSIMEVEILVDDGVSGGDDGSDDDGDDTTVVVEAGTLGTVAASAVLYDPRLGNSIGCDPDGCTAALTRDGDVSGASRWSCASSLGGTCSISYNLGAVRNLSELRLAMYKGATRVRTVDLSVDGVDVTTWTSSGTTADFESVDLSGHSGQDITITGVLADLEWLSIVETLIMVWPGDGVTTPPSPTPTTGDLVPVGLIPLADCTGCSGEDLPAFHAKDGDFSTSWTCAAADVNGVECTLDFDLFSYRHIKQIKIALPDGAERAVNMRISARYNSELTESFFTSSGTTDGFETYEFDVFTNRILIYGVFSSEADTISISEVEFVEEIQPGEIQVSEWDTPYDNGNGLWNEPTTDGFEWSSDSDEAIDRILGFQLASYALVSAVEMKFPVGDTHKFDLELNDDKIRGETLKTIPGWESANTAEWQSFDLSQHLDADEYLTEINIVIKGTGSGAPGFKMLDFRVMGTAIDNPTDTIYVGSTFIERWTRLSDRYPDFVAEGTGDQKTIMEAICAVKKASFDGVDCVGGDDTATGTVFLPQGSWFVDGNIFMKSGVFLDGSFSEDSPYFTGIILEEGAAGKTDIDAIVVMDGISNAKTDNIWIRGMYDPDTSNGVPAVSGLGSSCLSVVGSTNLTLSNAELRNCDGDAMVVRSSNMINIDAGEYEELFAPWSIASSRGTGLIVDSSDSVWVRRHTLYENGVAGIHITGSNNFTFDATIGPESISGEGNVGSTNGQQPIEVIVEDSTLVTFNDLRVQSSNDPIMTISNSSGVSFNNLGLDSIPTGTCVIQADDPATVTVDDEETELTVVGACYVKV